MYNKHCKVTYLVTQVYMHLLYNKHRKVYINNCHKKHCLVPRCWTGDDSLLIASEMFAKPGILMFLFFFSSDLFNKKKTRYVAKKHYRYTSTNILSQITATLYSCIERCSDHFYRLSVFFNL